MYGTSTRSISQLRSAFKVHVDVLSSRRRVCELLCRHGEGNVGDAGLQEAARSARRRARTRRLADLRALELAEQARFSDVDMLLGEIAALLGRGEYVEEAPLRACCARVGPNTARPAGQRQ